MGSYGFTDKAQTNTSVSSSRPSYLTITDHHPADHALKGPKKFLGATFVVDTYADLERAAKLLGSSAIQGLVGASAGGHLVTVYDPSGFPTNLMYGQKEREASADEQPAQITAPGRKPENQARSSRRAQASWGHCGFCAQDFTGEFNFYNKNFNFVPTDVLYVEGTDGTLKEAAIFFHIDLGVEHHAFFLTANAVNHVHHRSFEVHDYGTQMLGHAWLAKKRITSLSEVSETCTRITDL
ncbi:hypothetical protein GGS21DRAFT_320400 [Xylaria nigripes]|nr:hypothetical protein GGS21DRAFT_320400 [Xylaria nigripes]